METTTPHRRRRNPTRVALAVAFAVGVLSLTGAGVYAGLTATATGTAAVTSGTLSLTMAAGSGSVGLPQTVSNMAPGDVVNTFVDLSNGSGLAAKNLTLGVTGTGSTLLTTDATKGLAISVTQCSVAWTVATGVCSGTTTPLVTSTAVATLSSTPATVVSGSVATSASWHLRLGLTLPDQNETTVNGVPPTPTIQGLSTTLTYTFSESQRTATTTNV
jgi:hypothetical protein